MSRRLFDPLFDLKAKWNRCGRCAFSKWAVQKVWLRGDGGATNLLVGEAPGKEEDMAGECFVGAAGKILDEAVGKRMRHCAICNALLCRPCDGEDQPNRTPVRKDILNCRAHLEGIFNIIQPSLVILLGNVACESVFGTTGAPKVFIDIKGVTILRTLHPCAIVYNRDRVSEWKAFWRRTRKTLVPRWPTKRVWKLPLVGNMR